MLFWFAGQSFKKKKVWISFTTEGGLGELEGEGGSKANRLNLNPLFQPLVQPPSLHRVAQGGLKTTRLVNHESDLGFLCHQFYVIFLSSFHPSCVVYATLCFISFVGFMSGRCSIRATGKVPLFYCMPLNTVTIKWRLTGW